MSAVIDLDNATKGATAFSGIAIWGGVEGSGCRDIADACLAWLATRALSGIPIILLVTRWQPGAGPGRGSGQHLIR